LLSSLQRFRSRRNLTSVSSNRDFRCCVQHVPISRISHPVCPQHLYPRVPKRKPRGTRTERERRSPTLRAGSGYRASYRPSDGRRGGGGPCRDDGTRPPFVFPPLTPYPIPKPFVSRAARLSIMLGLSLQRPTAFSSLSLETHLLTLHVLGL